MTRDPFDCPEGPEEKLRLRGLLPLAACCCFSDQGLRAKTTKVETTAPQKGRLEEVVSEPQMYEAARTLEVRQGAVLT